ncbi:hypothetical protein [Acinetobacter sp. AL9]|uniref:hypothetical protein n=1 Tax=Acinetobacter sp. AL9 TaxID=3273234 RepID=UPI0035583588
MRADAALETILNEKGILRKAKGLLGQAVACGKEFTGTKYCTIKFGFVELRDHSRNYVYISGPNSKRIEFKIESINNKEIIEQFFIANKSNVLVEVEFPKLGSFIYAVKSGYIDQLFNLDK